ncbi:unnamed protein product (mitochondrion) [Plasmodiophora brassicae]|uniref:Uncharacterized protein n=1 Tax=Plasmodiophora brassicae TaxID=37360 RepID=A0A0G4IL13_PLABS|nr:hypothetical protein PBRA_004631 [Plasmodiophora brassicae]SPQ93509.1 unnamed protein product [Plasmodiophora brassicae]
MAFYEAGGVVQRCACKFWEDNEDEDRLSGVAGYPRRRPARHPHNDDDDDDILDDLVRVHERMYRFQMRPGRHVQRPGWFMYVPSLLYR